MAQDNILEFRCSDGVPITSVYVPTSGHPDEIFPMLQKKLKELDKGNFHGRLNWDLVVSLAVASVITTIKHSKIMNPNTAKIKYMDFRTVIEPTDAYADTKNSINNVVKVHTRRELDTNLENYIYSGALSGYEKVLSENDVYYKALVRELDMFFVVKGEGGFILELAPPDVTSKAYHPAPTIVVSNVHDARHYDLALEYLFKTGTGLLTKNQVGTDCEPIDLSLFHKKSCGSIAHPQITNESVQIFVE